MLWKNHLRLAFRSLRRHRAYAGLNLVGLAVGLACCLLILLFLHHEYSFDRFHTAADRIYRVETDAFVRGRAAHSASTAYPLAPALVAAFPEIEAATRTFTFRGNPTLARRGDTFHAVNVTYTDAAFLEVFPYPLLQGDAATALQRPHTAVLLGPAAERLLGSTDVVGQTVRMEIDRVEQLIEITGVLAPPPGPSHFGFEMLISLGSHANTRAAGTWQRRRSYRTYVRVREGASVASLLARLPAFAEARLGASWVTERQFSYALQPLTQIHLDREGVRATLQVFGWVALLVLLMACANYINLTTARATTRAHEVGVRKVLGAQRSELLRQFGSESLLLAALAMLVALALTVTLLPGFGWLLGQPLRPDALWSREGWLVIFGLTASMGLVAGLYPALVLSSFGPMAVLRRGFPSWQRPERLRKALILFQVVLAAFLVTGALGIQKQVRFMQLDLGYAADDLVQLTLPDRSLYARADALKATLLQHPDIARVGRMQGSLAGSFGGIRWEALRPDGTATYLYATNADADLLDATQIPLHAGRWFSDDLPSDAGQAVVLNLSAVQALGWDAEQAIGQVVSARTVIGVVEDFHFHPKHVDIRGVAFFNNPEATETLVARLRPGHTESLPDYLEAAWQAFAPDHPLVVEPLESGIAALYEAERRLGRLAANFAGLAILLAGLGFLGLAAFMAQQRTKEVGIRKVLGASLGQITSLFTKEFLRLTGAALFVALPLAYGFFQQWLQNFAYRAPLAPSAFIGVALGLLGLTLLTVSYHAVRAALRNPVEAIRHE